MEGAFWLGGFITLVSLLFAVIIIKELKIDMEMKKKIWKFFLLMVCCFGFWVVFETAPEYRIYKGKKYRRRGSIYWEKDYGAIIFRLLPIVASGVGIYLLFLRKRKE